MKVGYDARGRFLIAVAIVSCAITASTEAAQRFSASRNGMVAASTPYATAAGVRILEKGGNAVDAGAAACFALMVTDPPMTSLGGRTQILIALAHGKVAAIDGATRAPAAVPPLKGEQDDRRGYAAAPVPGNPAALAQAVQTYGRLSLADVLQPAIELAEQGFAVTPRVAAAWARTRDELARNPGAAANFLHTDGSPYKAGEIFRQPRLAAVLRQIARSGPGAFYRGDIAAAVARDFAGQGGFIRPADLAAYRALPGVVVRTNYRGYEVASAGGRAWGDTVVEMLNILSAFPLPSEQPSSREVEILAQAMAQALEDRPQELNTLKPKKNGYELRVLSSPEFGRQRARRLQEQLGKPMRITAPAADAEPQHTTHLSVMDGSGNAIAITTSIGPVFGTRIVTPELGFFYAHSYRMRADPSPEARDETEMSPTIVLRRGRPVLAVGAAGSERIPTAIVQVINNVVDRSHSLQRAVSAPRIYSFGNRIRTQGGFPESVIGALRDRGFEVTVENPDATFHLGVVHAVQYDPASGEYFGAADPVSDGSAAGPTALHRGP